MDLWARRKPADIATLLLSGTAGAVPLARTAFRVEQTQSSGFGYAVRPARDGKTAEMEAFAVPVPMAGAGRLRLDIPEAGFTREVVVVGARCGAVSGLLDLVPVLALHRRRAA